MAQKIYAHRDIPIEGFDPIKRGDVVIELPEHLTLQTLVTMATCGELGEEPPMTEPVPATQTGANSVGPLAATVDAPAAGVAKSVAKKEPAATTPKAGDSKPPEEPPKV